MKRPTETTLTPEQASALARGALVRVAESRKLYRVCGWRADVGRIIAKQIRAGKTWGALRHLDPAKVFEVL